MSVRPPVRSRIRMGQLGSHWTDFHEIRYLDIFREYVQKTQVSLKPDKNNGYFTGSKIYIFDHNSLISSYSEKCVIHAVEKTKTHILCSITFFLENRADYEIMWKNTVESGRLQMTTRCMRIAY